MGENSVLRHQTLTILQQIEELKNWHKQQQSKLNPDKKSLINNAEAECKEFKGSGVKNIKDSEGGNRNYTAQHQNIDEIPIKVTNPNFIDYIENNIIPNEVEHNQKSVKSKFKYLKRGEGIARFRMGPRKVPKYGKRSNQTLKLSANTTKYVENISHNIEDNQKTSSALERLGGKIDVPNLDPPDVKLDFKNWKSIFNNGQTEQILEKVIENNRLEMFQPNSSIDSSTASIMEKLIAVGRKHLKEREELRVFEAMEEHVMDSSFCSTSSYVAKLMEHAVISTPLKDSPRDQLSIQTIKPNQEVPVGRGNQVVKVRNITENKSDPASSLTQPEQQKESENKLQDETVNGDDSEPSLHVRFAEEVDYKSFIENSQSFSSANQTVKASDKRFDESEEWKEDSNDGSSCSECRTQYSSSDEDAIPISPPGTPPLERQGRQNCPAAGSRTGSSTRLNMVDLASNDKPSVDNGMGMFPPVLSIKLKELEEEIEIFRIENNKLKAIREKLEKEYKSFQLEKKKFLNEIEEEKKKNIAQLEEEKKKLAKEKFIFEKYSKSLTKNPTKEERKEMQALREQLSEIKEELNKKESRWGAAQARVRNQVKHLEDDNKKLREEVETLRRQSKSLEILTRKKKGKVFTNTKLIHAINEHISSVPLGGEDDIAQGVTGYFDHQPKPAKTNEIPVDEVDPKSLNTVRVIREDAPKQASRLNREDHPVNNSEKRTSLEDISSIRPSKDGGTTGIITPINETRYTNHNSASSDSRSDGGTTGIITPINETRYTNHNSASSDSRSSSEFVEASYTNSLKETILENGNIQRVYPDGKKEIRYKNGNVKKIDPFTGSEKTILFNGDVEEIVKDGTVKYYFSESRIWQTTLPDGLEVWDFPNGQLEKRHTDGMVEVVYPNNCKKLTYPNGLEEIYYADGTTLKIEGDKRKVLLLPNGQREVHTDESIRREYPDGTVKIVYPDGTTETVYSDGRVRLKDKHGNLVMDSGTLNK